MILRVKLNSSHGMTVRVNVMAKTLGTIRTESILIKSELRCDIVCNGSNGTDFTLSVTGCLSSDMKREGAIATVDVKNKLHILKIKHFEKQINFILDASNIINAH